MPGLVSLAADKGYGSKAFGDQLRDEGVRLLIKHRLIQPIGYAHNARLGRRWVQSASAGGDSELVNQTVDSRHD